MGFLKNMIIIENEFSEHPDITLIPNDVPPEEAQKYAKVVDYPDDMPLKEAIGYVRYFEMNYPQHTEDVGIVKLSFVSEKKEEVDLDFLKDSFTPFERIRRITGYLVGTIDRFNDAKRHEVEDRVKHNVSYER